MLSVDQERGLYTYKDMASLLLQVRLKVVASVLGKLGLTVAGLVFVALMIR